MQVTAKTITEKQPGLDGQIQSKDKSAATSPRTQVLKSEENATAAKGAERNETSQYLKVLSRIENLLIQEKLPDAAIDGFVGAIKKQIGLMSEVESQMLLKLPEAIKLELKDLSELPELIKNTIRDDVKSSALLELLRQPKFAVLMKTDGKPAPKTYTAQSAQAPTNGNSSPIKILEIPIPQEKPVLVDAKLTDPNSNVRKSTVLSKMTA